MVRLTLPVPLRADHGPAIRRSTVQRAIGGTPAGHSRLKDQPDLQRTVDAVVLYVR